MADNEPAVVVKDLYKTFRLPHEQSTGIKQLLVNFAKRKRGYETQKVLNDVSFEIKKGEFFGIVGRNGSGKSTLLKLLAGIYTPDKGLVQVNGSLTPFIELGVGFNPELTGRENVYMNGALLGFSNAEMDAMYDDIVEFAELEKFMDQKLKNYSSGMQVRLAFSVAIRAKSDILLIDEVLAVGDAAFQQKCFNYFNELKNSGQTVILVTHDMGAVKQFCDSALLINKGVIEMVGKPDRIALEYEKLNFAGGAKESATENKMITIRDEAGKKTDSVRYGETFSLTARIESGDVKIAGFIINKNGEDIFGTNTIDQKVSVKGDLTLTLKKPKIGNGRYKIIVGLFGHSRNDVIEFIEGPEVVIYGQPLNGRHGEEWHGVSYIDTEWSAKS
jgi:ABC-2 type transport system ATP-binding protein